MENNDWIDVKERLPEGESKKVYIKKNAGCIGEHEGIAKYYESSPSFLHFYGIKPCHWWDIQEQKYIHNVTQWKEIE